MRRLLFILPLILFPLLSFPLTIQDIKEKYSNIRTFQADFKQELYVSSLDAKRELSGEVYLKRKRGFLWIYRKPKFRYFLFDGSFLYQVDEERPYVTKERLDESKIQGYFLDLLEDMTNLDKHFRVKRVRNLTSEIIVELEPRENETILEVILRFDSHQNLLGLEIFERNGNRNKFRFSKVRLDAEIPEERFTFKIPIGKEIVERPNNAPQKR